MSNNKEIKHSILNNTDHLTHFYFHRMADVHLAEFSHADECHDRSDNKNK